MCRGGSSFDELKYLRDDLKINDGLVLNHGYISYVWQNIMFWRTFVAIFLHTLSLLSLQSLGLKLGFFTNKEISTRNDDIVERPGDDSVTAYSFIRQQFYHKAFAANAYEKRKYIRRRKCCKLL